MFRLDNFLQVAVTGHVQGPYGVNYKFREWSFKEQRYITLKARFDAIPADHRRTGASKIQFFAKDTPDLNFKERADQWQQLKENKPEEIRRYQNLLDEHHHNIYKARFDAIPAGVVQSYKAKLAKEQISDENI